MKKFRLFAAGSAVLAAGFGFGLAVDSARPVVELDQTLAVAAPATASDLPAGAVIVAGVRGPLAPGDRAKCSHGKGLGYAPDGTPISGDGWLCYPLTVKP